VFDKLQDKKIFKVFIWLTLVHCGSCYVLLYVSESGRRDVCWLTKAHVHSKGLLLAIFL